MSAESATSVRQATSTPSDDERSRRLTKTILIAHAIMVLSQLPLTIVQYVNLWKLSPHYRFFPFLIGAVAFLIFKRWPRTGRPFVRSRFANILLAIGLVFSLGATAFVNPSFANVSVLFLLGSLLARTRDTQTNKTLLPVWWLSLLAIQFPLNLDVELITRLQQISAKCTSMFLDMMGYTHNMPGTVLEFPGKSYFVEEACSGVQSFFTLLFCSALYCVWVRRGVIHSFALVSLAVFWAIVMNILRILLIPIFDIEMGLDLTEGVPHDILGYSVLIFAVLMVASSDALLTFILGPVPLEPDSAVVRYWSVFVSVVTFAKLRKRLRSRRNDAATSQNPDAFVPALGGPGRIGLWAIAVVIGLTAIVQAFDASRMFRENYRVAFGLDTIIELAEQDLDASIGPWQCTSYEQLDRPLASELGQRSDSWQFQGTTYNGFVSLDQPFPGWHELSICYINQGWEISKPRDTLTERRDDLNSDWDFIEIEFVDSLGEHGYLLFSFFDILGQPVEAPDSSSPFSFLMQRVKNRLNVRIREQLFSSEVYQTQVFVPSTQPLTEDEKREIKSNYLKAREALRQRVAEINGEAEPRTSASR